MLPTGELLILNVSHMDAMRSYRCRTHHQLTQEAVVSSNAGRIQLSSSYYDTHANNVLRINIPTFP